MAKRQFQDTHGLEQMQAYQATIVNQGDLVWKSDVNTTDDLPANGNIVGDTRLVKSSGYAYRYTNEGWKKISGGGGAGGSTSWGDIEGTLSDQADLNEALNSKASAESLSQLSETVGEIARDMNDKLESTDLKTVNGQSLVGEGDIEIDGIAKSSTAPANPEQGDVYYNTTDNKIYSYDGEKWNEVGNDFDPNGYYPALHAGQADNLYTTDNIIDVAVWNFRTTAGAESVPSSGTASLNYIRGKSVRTTAKTECVINCSASDGIFINSENKYRVLYATNNMTGTYTFTLTSGVWNTDPSTYGISATLQQAEFSIDNGSFTDDGTTFKTYVDTARGNFTMAYDTDNSVWVLTNGTDIWSNADTTTFGIATPGSTTDIVTVRYYDECTDGTITLSFTAEVRGEITSSTPATLLATGVNQFNGSNLISSAEIDANGEIVAGSNYIAFVPAYGGVVNGYMGYCPDGYIVNCGWIDGLENTPDFGSTVNTTENVVTSTSCYMPNENTGWFLVEVSASVDDTDLSIHPKRSGQQDTNTDGYSESTVTFPTEDVNNVSLPTFMPSVGDTYDELSGQTQTYIKRIEVLAFTYSDLLTIAESGVEFDYDEDYIYYVLGNPVTYDVSFTNTYTANDYGTEFILDSNDDLNALMTENSTSYGSNLVDKLRTGVVTKEEYPQVITQTEYDNLPATKTTDGIIRFIYTVE